MHGQERLRVQTQLVGEFWITSVLAAIACGLTQGLDLMSLAATPESKRKVSQMAFPGADGDTLPDIDGNEADYDIVSYELEPGDMLVHHHLTVHGSAGNATLR